MILPIKNLTLEAGTAIKLLLINKFAGLSKGFFFFEK